MSARRHAGEKPTDGLRGVVAALADGIVVMDRSGRVRFANPAACVLLGRPLMSLVGSDLGLAVAVGAMVENEVTVAGLTRVVELHASRGRWSGEEAVVVALRDVTARKQAVAELEEAAQRALNDPLTGLPSRALLVDRIDQALARSARTGGVVSVAFVDLDGFKPVNDRFGHAAGDLVLQTIARRMAAAVRPADTVCRLGGDEFVVVCEGLAGTAEARELAERIEAAVELPTRLDGHEVLATASIGVATAGPGAGTEELLRDADAAMLQAKQEGKARARVYDDTSRVMLSERVRLESGLQSAVEAGRLRLAYQPVVNLSTGAVVGCEALLRYDDPDHGVLPADSFIRLAETAGVVVPMGNWALQKACRDASAWHDAGKDLPVTVNIGPAHLASVTLLAAVTTALDAAGMPAAMLALDVTEGAVSDLSGPSLGAIADLSDHGVRVGVDHWGAGPASVTALTRLPLSYVKLDRSVVAQLVTSRRSADVLLAAVRAAGLRAVAAGIESVEQIRPAMALGCVEGQGYHFAAPMPADAVVDYVTAI